MIDTVRTKEIDGKLPEAFRWIGYSSLNVSLSILPVNLNGAS